MRLPATWRALLVWAESLSPDQTVLRALTAVGMTLAVAATSAASGATVWWLLLVSMALLAGAVARPDSHAAAAFVFCVGVAWYTTVDHPLSAGSLVAAIGLLVVHLSCALAATAPVATRLETRSRRRWLVQAAVIGAVTAAIFGLGRTLLEARLTGSSVLTAAAFACVAVLAAYLRVQETGDEV